MPTVVLDFEEEYDFDLIGISSHEKEYRLVWSLNKAMRWQLTRQEDIRVEQRNYASLHACYAYYDASDKCKYVLIENHSADGFMLPEIPNWDYILKVEHHQNHLDEAIYKALKKVNFVLAVTPLIAEKLKSRQNLIFS